MTKYTDGSNGMNNEILGWDEEYEAYLKRHEKPVDPEKEAEELRKIIEEFEERIHG
ncbi:hypothetical protein ACX80O_04260 [Arthrobacter sp. Hz1]